MGEIPNEYTADVFTVEKIPDEYAAGVLTVLARWSRSKLNYFFRNENGYTASIIVTMPDGAMGCVEEANANPEIAQANCCRRAITALVYESLVSMSEVELAMGGCEPNERIFWFKDPAAQ